MYYRPVINPAFLSIRTTGTPSPMSPTPSPSGSVGSIGSVGSNGSQEAITTPSRNGKQAMASPVTVNIPQRIHTFTNQHLNITNHLLYSHDLWDISETLLSESNGKCFTLQLDCECLMFCVFLCALTYSPWTPFPLTTHNNNQSDKTRTA